jgi:hypothetical protein
MLPFCDRCHAVKLQKDIIVDLKKTYADAETGSGLVSTIQEGMNLQELK